MAPASGASAAASVSLPAASVTDTDLTPYYYGPDGSRGRVVAARIAPGAGEWAQRAPMPQPRTEMMSSIVAAGGKVYVIGGYNIMEGRFDGNLNQVYDPAADRWQTLAPIPRGGNHLSAVHLDGRIYVVGGFVKQNASPIANAWAYDIAANTWRAIAPLPRPLGSVGLVVLNGRIHSVGGRDSVSVGDHYVYDPRTNRWVTEAPLPGARDHAGVVAHDGYIHVFGGRFNEFEYNTDTHYAWSSLTRNWKARARMPVPTSGHIGVLYKGLLLAMGGEGTGVVHGDVQAYDPATDSWVQLAPMPVAKHGTSGAVVGEWIYIPGGGGTHGGAVPTASNQAFRIPDAAFVRGGGAPRAAETTPRSQSAAHPAGH